MGNQEGVFPHRVRDTAEFVALMRDLKERSGLTYRQLEERAAERGEVLARSTLADALTGRTAPRPELLTAFVRACGEEERLQMWLAAREQAVGSQRADTGGPNPPGNTGNAGDSGSTGGAGDTPPRKAAGRRAAAVATAAALLGGVGVWLVTASGGEPGGDGIVPGAESVSPAPGADPLSGWVRIRPVTAPTLCLTDGRVRDRRYTPLVAVQRPCDRVAPQGTLLEPVGGNAYRIQWHHPDHGKGCLRVLPRGAGAGLLEPHDDCARGSRFHIEPSGPRGGGGYVFRVDGHGCVGIRGSDPSEGAEATVERCTGKGGQVFAVESAW
ncbi:helix-turn-helix transcriptional regulator [Streptomyces somaliensis]|uniref:helix-turn-helix domain-containing protein n=1 Tax=Streptomyces somaliensis TaxID=78355 RepID=UPI0034E98C02|nr:helix-turn-helix transcriptional regulator [Streptomyces somaliensis]MCP9974342.1 helix-turn-helix transcriptional regulator [Streptomyces somaliensis]